MSIQSADDEKYRKAGEFYAESGPARMELEKYAEYAQWKALKRRIEQMRGATIGERYGYKPDAPSLISAVTYVFLHGSGLHLFGNMLLDSGR